MRHRVFNIILLIFVAFTASSQINNSATYRVATNLTDFGKNIPAGTVVTDMGTNKMYLFATAATSVQDLTDLVEGTNKIELGIASDINWSLSGSDLLSDVTGKVILDVTSRDNTSGLQLQDGVTDVLHLWFNDTGDLWTFTVDGTNEAFLQPNLFGMYGNGGGTLGDGTTRYGFAFNADLNTGLNWLGADNFVINTGGVSSMEFTETASAVDIEVGGTMSFGTNSLGYDAANQGIFFSTDGNIAVGEYVSQSDAQTSRSLVIGGNGNTLSNLGTPTAFLYNTDNVAGASNYLGYGIGGIVNGNARVIFGEHYETGATSNYGKAVIIVNNGTSPQEYFSIDDDGSIQLNAYGSGTFTGTATKWLAVDASGNLIEEDAPVGGTAQNLSYNAGTHAIDIDQGGTSAVIPLAAADGSTLGLSAFLAAEFSASSGIISLLSDGIDETHLDWGTGAGQISAVDILIADGGGIITATEVEGALQENRTAIDLNTTHRTSTGADHTYIDQSVVSGSTPTFTNTNFTASTNKNYLTDAQQSALHTQNTDSDTKPDATLDADHTADGMIMTFTAGTGGFSYGQVGYVSASQTLTIADADATTTAPVVGICIESAGITAASTGSFLINGVVRDDTWNWTIGGEIYLDVTAGALTQTAPSATGDIVQIVGIAITADIMLFNPQLAYGVLK